MQIKINQRDAPALEFKDGRYYYTFTATEDTSSVDIFSDCLGDTQFKKIQIEKNSEMTSFAPPKVYEGSLSGIFKDLKEINLEMKDTESDFWGKIKLNARGMLEEYHNGTLSAEFMKTASGIEQRLRNALSQSENRFTSTADGIRRDLTNVDGRINSVTSTVDGYKQTLISTQAKVDNLKVGGRNLFLKTKDFGGEWFNKGDWTINAETYQGLVVKKRSGLWRGISQAVPVKVGEVYTFSTYVKTDKTDETIRFYSTHNGTGNPATTDVSTKILPVSDEWQRVNVTFKVTKSGNISPRLERTNEGTIWVAGLKLERGSIATDWTPAPEDLVSGSDFTTYKNEVTETAEGLTRRIEATDGRVNQITETVDGFKREITNSVTGRINTVIETVNGVKREIKSSVDDSLSEMTQNINGFKRLVQDAEKNHSQLAQTVSGLESTVNNNQKNMTSRITQLAGLIDQKVARGDLEGIIRNSGDSIWLAVRDRVTTAAGNSKMSGREIINAINVTTGGTLIRSGDNKLMVTPTTTFIQNGTIKSAMIDTLDASKITTGTLNAAIVRAINLDVSQITGDKMRFIEGAFQAANSILSINGAGIKITTPNSGRLVMNEDGFQFQGKLGEELAQFSHYVDHDTRLSKGVGWVAVPNARLAFGYYPNQTRYAENSFEPAMELDGDYGHFSLASSVFPYVNYNKNQHVNGFRLDSGIIKTSVGNEEFVALKMVKGKEGNDIGKITTTLFFTPSGLYVTNDGASRLQKIMTF
ncbi:hypothetical protein JDW15_08825 [Aerococcaceae bacterium zg-ZJ1578]|uniref:gp58-like family protein n=1 Tax=Aerococcaceae bacterium zg-252 TaxID=2796928 RepID=UPI001A20D076|nr:hypothetical protein [Aerococcaceae bacterium zg-1578]